MWSNSLGAFSHAHSFCSCLHSVHIVVDDDRAKTALIWSELRGLFSNRTRLMEILGVSHVLNRKLPALNV